VFGIEDASRQKHSSRLDRTSGFADGKAKKQSATYWRSQDPTKFAKMSSIYYIPCYYPVQVASPATSSSAIRRSPSTSSLSYCLLPPLRERLPQVSHRNLTPTEKAANQEQRIKFLLFIKILFRHLRTTRNFLLLARAQRLLRIIVREHRAGDPHYEPLFENIETRLRLLVGESHWRRAHYLMRYYLHNKKVASPSRVGIPKKPHERRENDKMSKSS
jgi:hypothetical protein